MYKNPLYYVALGDSITVGIGSLFTPNFVKRYTKISERELQSKIYALNFGKNGATTGEVLKRLNKPSTQRAVKGANIVTITAGGNDLLDAVDLAYKKKNRQILYQSLFVAQSNMRDIIDNILYLRSGHLDTTMIRIVNLYNSFPHLYVVEEWVEAYNQYLFTLQSMNVRVADVHSAFSGNLKKLILFDQVHPNPNGYKVITYEIYRTGYSPLK